MKKGIFLTFIFTILFSTFALTAEEKEAEGTAGDALMGTYITAKGTMKIRIYKCKKATYCGEVVWLKYNSKDRLDLFNPDKKLGSDKVMGLIVLKNMVYNKKKNQWDKGSFYSVTTGHNYYCIMTLEGGKLKLKISMDYGFWTDRTGSWGKTSAVTKADAEEKPKAEKEK